MNDIAERVGVRKPSLYNYYRSKERLFLDLLDRSLEDWRQASRAALAGEGALAPRLKSHLERAVAFAVEHPHDVAICRLAVTQLTGSFGRRVRARLVAQSEDYRGELETRFAAAIESGELRPAAPEDLVVAWSVFLDGILFNIAFELGAGAALPTRLDALWRALWRGLAAEDGSAS